MVKKLKTNKVFFSIKKLLFVFAVASATFFIATLFNNSHQRYAYCANKNSCTKDVNNKIENNSHGYFLGKRIVPPKIDPTEQKREVLGSQTEDSDKHIFIDLKNQTLVAYEGDEQILKTFVSTGKWNKTPTGNFHIWIKLRSTRMSGGTGNDAYDLPNVPYTMYFYRDYGIHGAYWHNNFGYPMSHGCVNMRQVDAKILFEWADGPSGDRKGTMVSVCDEITNDNNCVQNNPIQI